MSSFLPTVERKVIWCKWCVNEFSSIVLTLARRWHKLHCFTLFTDKLCSDIVKAYLFSLSTHPLKSFRGSEIEVRRHRRGIDRHIDTYVIVV